MTYQRGTIQEFHQWHNEVKDREGISGEGKIGYRSGMPSPFTQRTIQYSKPIKHPMNPNDYIWLCGGYKIKNKTLLSLEDVQGYGWFKESL